MDVIWAALQDSSFAAFVRNSTFVYPIANITHVVAVIAFFGLVATMDLRLLQISSGEPARALVKRLRPAALIVLAVIAAAGFILFSAEAVALARNTAFQIKIAAIGLALLNIGINEWTLRNHGERYPLVRFTAGFSLFIWLFVAAMGRTIAYI
ncbi:MAG: hypothetical protein H7X89_06230 [Rhizobiales bacterium]|nr:hypothetical protein [Hyphomicrobiales bacterium]